MDHQSRVPHCNNIGISQLVDRPICDCPPNRGAGQCNRRDQLCGTFMACEGYGLLAMGHAREGPTMRLNHGMIALMLSATALMSAGCAGGGLYYDSYGHDYHRWNRGEDRFYRQWESGTHRNHMGFNQRSAGEQRAYWGWRHK
jgi:hypothetical protein